MTDDRGSAHAFTYDHSKACLAPVTANGKEPDVMQKNGGPVFRRSADRNLELTGQEGELRVEGRPLSQQLAPDKRVDDLIRRDAGEVIHVMLRTQFPEV